MEQKPYWQQLRDQKLARTQKPEAVDRQRKKDLKEFYETQGTQHKGKCENCGDSLASTINFHSRAVVAHIVAKGKHGCPSVATHPNNVWFACMLCHQIWDGTDTETILTMPVLPMLKQRLKLFYNDIAENERRRIPKFLLDEKA